MSIVILRLKVTQFVLFGMSLGRGVISRLGTGPITCGDLVNDIGEIRAGRTGGSSMDELEASRESSSSIRGASGRDLHLERGMLGYRGMQHVILSHGQKRLYMRTVMYL